jgi:nitroreductase
VIDIDRIGEDVALLEGIRTARAVRRLRPDPVPPALIRKVCEAGTFAPSGGNRQPWIFVAVTDTARRAAIAAIYRELFAAYIAPAVAESRAPDFPASRRRILEGAVHLAEHLHETPVHLFVAGWTRRGAPQPQALFPAIQNVLLACRAVGLGASLTTIHTARGPEIDRMLELPHDRPSIALLPMGWPAVPFRRAERRPVDECLFWERFEER